MQVLLLDTFTAIVFEFDDFVECNKKKFWFSNKFSKQIWKKDALKAQIRGRLSFYQVQIYF